MSVESEIPKEISPGLTAEQIRRLEHFGTRERVAEGTVLFDEGDRGIDFFVLLDGAMEICHYSEGGMKHVVRHKPGASWAIPRRSPAAPRSSRRAPMRTPRSSGSRPTSSTGSSSRTPSSPTYSCAHS